MASKRQDQTPTAPAAAATGSSGRLTARPAAAPAAAAASPGPGRHPLGLASGRDGYLYLPAGHRPERPAPLAVMLHGAGGEARHGIGLLQPLADAAGLILLAPDSRGRSWDVIARDGYGPDITYLDRALAWTFERCAVDATRLAIGGFSDGASYALSVGLTNGDLFTHVLAFSPGFMAPARQEGKPGIYVSHGTRDEVLPIARCSRQLVPRLERAGYEVIYREFDGPHTVPAEIAREATDWLAGGRPG